MSDDLTEKYRVALGNLVVRCSTLPLRYFKKADQKYFREAYYAARDVLELKTVVEFEGECLELTDAENESA